MQVEGLIGSRGISPAAEFMAQVAEIAEPDRFRRVPTLLWLSSTDAALHALCAGGVMLSLLLAAGAGSAAAVQGLLAAGADPGHEAPDGATALAASSLITSSAPA